METGEFPASTRTFLFDKGTIGNTHFVAIGKNSGNIPGALALIDTILSPEAQAGKYDPAVWGDMPVLTYEMLSEEQQRLFDDVPQGPATPELKELQEKGSLKCRRIWFRLSKSSGTKMSQVEPKKAAVCWAGLPVPFCILGGGILLALAQSLGITGTGHSPTL